jgi:hypothetical protein
VASSIYIHIIGRLSIGEDVCSFKDDRQVGELSVVGRVTLDKWLHNPVTGGNFSMHYELTQHC